MIEEDAAAAIHAVTLAIIDGNVMAVHLGHAVRTPRVEGGCLRLRRFANLAEHFAATCLVETSPPWGEQADRLQDPSHADGRELPSEYRLLPARGHKAHGSEVVDLRGLHLAQHINQRQLIEQVRLMQGNALTEVTDALKILRAGAANDAVHFIA